MFAKEPRSELSFKEIDSLIEQTEYDDALRALSDYIKKHPDSLDPAQKRIDKIMKARKYYAKLADELLTVIEREPENDEKKLAIIKQLENLERHPGEKRLAFIREAKIAAEFSYYRSQFRRIMEEGANETKLRDYDDAIAKIKTGFYMYRDEFFENFPSELTDEVSQKISELEGLCKNYSDARSEWQNAYEAFISAVRTKNYENAARAWEPFFAQMQNFSQIRNALVQNGIFFERTFENVRQENPDANEVLFLSFMSHFALGSASIEHSGILGALDADWNFMTENSKREIYIATEQKLSSFIAQNPVSASLEEKSFPDFSVISECANFSSLALNANSLHSLLNDKNGNSQGDICPLYSRSVEFLGDLLLGTEPSFANMNEFKSAAYELGVLTSPENLEDDAKSEDGYGAKTRDLIARLDATQNTAAENLSAAWFVSYKNDFALQRQEKNSAQEEIASEKKSEKSREKKIEQIDLLAVEDALLDWARESDFYESINALTLSQSELAKNSAWRAFGQYYAGLANDIQKKYEGSFDEAERLASEHYPAEALQSALSVQEEIAKDEALLKKMNSDFEKGFQKDNAEGRAEIRGALARLRSAFDQGERIANQARAESRLAQSSRDRANEVYSQSEAALRREDFSSARQNLQRARELYNESLSHQESQELRETSDKNLAELGQRINDAENRIIVVEVRNLKTRAKTEYYASNFETAENVLNRAEARWAVANVDPDEEIVNLKLLVQNALAMKTGREIKPTAPLYPEMSQILSNAHQYYDKGEALIKEGKRSEAVEILNEAKKKLQELQMVYPLNQEASLLTLRIENLIDPVQFNENFARRVEAARDNVRIAATQQQAYSDLLDLYEIRPNYPGLQKIIYDIEMDLGLRARPVDQSGLIRSANLTQEAQRLYDSAGGNEEILRQALSRLNQAISLNPNNENAIMLKDKIQIAVGGKAAVVLSAADEANYNRAIQALRGNNIVGAYTIVQQLLQNPANRRSTKILALQKQIQARL